MESIKCMFDSKSTDQMKLLHRSIFSIFLVILVIPSNVASQTSITDFDVLTWSNEIEKDATYSWKVNTLSQNGDPVDNIDTYGVTEGMVIQIKVLVDLSEVNIIDFINDTLELPNPSDYVELSAQGVKINFLLFDTIVFIVPTDLVISEGETNSFYVLDSSDLVVFSKENDVKPITKEYVEFDNSNNSEEFVWDLSTGLLKSIKINHTNGFKFDMTLEDTDNITIDDTPISTRSLIFGFLITMVLIRKRK